MRNFDQSSPGRRRVLAVSGLIFIAACFAEPVQSISPAVPVSHEAIIAEGAPAAIGPYSQAVRVGEVVYLAGQIGMDPESGQLVVGGIEAETKQALDNLGAVLEQAGLGYDNVVRATVFLSDLNDFPAMNGVYKGYFRSDHPPARSTVQVVAIPRGALVEIDFIAVN
jgi:2-iminobutanoate/2-iminopropanoate deaminase